MRGSTPVASIAGSMSESSAPQQAEGSSRVDIWITDHGKGFNVSEARSRRQNLGAVHKRGWGLQIIEAHMDEVDISTGPDGGTTIHMVKIGKSEAE